MIPKVGWSHSGTLCVYRDLQWLPCNFYSRQLLPRERNYAIYDLEALALLATIHHFHYYLSGVYFKAFTDHKPLINILNGQPPSARLLRWKIKLSDYHFDIIHIAGEVNSVADALSRQSWTSMENLRSPSEAASRSSISEGRGGVV